MNQSFLKCLAILSMALIGCGAPRSSDPFAELSPEKRREIAEAYFERGAQYRQGSEYEKMLLDSAVIADPSYAEAWYERSAWLIKIGDYEGYMKEMDRAVALEPMLYLGWRGSIKNYYLHDYVGALKDYHQLLQIIETPTTGARGEDLLFAMGKAYWQLEKYEEAIEYFTRSIEVISADQGEEWVDVYTFVFRALSFHASGDNTAAHLDLDKALHYWDKCVEAWYWKAFLYAGEGKIEEACTAIKNSIQFKDEGYLRTDAYREVFGQLYERDLAALHQQVCEPAG